MSPPNSPGIQGLQFPADGGSDFNAISAIFRSMLSRVATSTLVKVVKCTNEGGVSPVGFVDIQPLINQVDGDGNAVPHGVIYGCPYSRMQGGGNAIILDPKPGDIGVAVFASRDIAGVIAKRAAANPGSNGRFRWSDGLYIGGMLNGTPTQWIRFSDDGIEIVSPTQVKLEAPDVRISCATLEIAATTSASVTTPIWTVNGNQHVTGSLVVDGGVLAEDALTVVGIANFNGGANVDSKSIGPAHTHNLSGGGHTLGVT